MKTEPKKTSAYRLSSDCHKMITEMVLETGEKAPAIIEQSIRKSYSDIIEIARIRKTLTENPAALKIVKDALSKTERRNEILIPKGTKVSALVKKMFAQEENLRDAGIFREIDLNSDLTPEQKKSAEANLKKVQDYVRKSKRK